MNNFSQLKTIGLFLTVIAVVVVATFFIVDFQSPPETEAVLYNGLVGWWGFDKSAGNLATGTNVVDLSSGNHDARVKGSTARVSGKYYQSMEFDGSGYLNVSSDLGNPAGMSLSLWFKKPDINAGAQYFLDGRNGGNWWLLQDYNNCGGQTPETGNICFENRVAVQPEDLSNNTWYHLVVTENSTESKIYLNGTLKDTGSGEAPAIGNDMRIGTRYTDSSRFHGLMDEVRVYNRVLSATEIDDLYLSGPNIYGYAWSDNVGWISFNHTNEGESIGYSASVHPLTKHLSGWAWSDNAGWITFNRSEAGTPPSDDYCNNQRESCLAMFDRQNNLHGWARALAPKDEPATVAGGWDGWIKMNGSSPDYGVNFNNGSLEMNGYGWGDTVLGWLKFNDNTIPSSAIDYQVKSLTALALEADNCIYGRSPCNTNYHPAPPPPTLKWDFYGGTSHGYDVEVYSDVGLTNLVYQYETDSVTDGDGDGQHVAGYDEGTCHVGSNGFQNDGASPPCQYHYGGTTYYWRVRVLHSQNSQDLWGDWSDTATFNIAESHHYPYPQFNYPGAILAGSLAKFRDNSDCRDANPYTLVDYSGYDRTNDTGNTTANFNNGVALQDGSNAGGYLMYSEQSVHDRFTATGSPEADNADHFIGVRYDDNDSQWYYDNNIDWYEFTPASTDLLVAKVTWGVSDIEKRLVGDSEVHSIDTGYKKSNLKFIAHQWGGNTNTGEIDLGLVSNSCASGDYDWGVNTTLNADYDAWNPYLNAGYHFNEGQGDNTADFSEYGNTGSIQNATSGIWVSGKYGDALDFNGDNNYVEVSDDDSLDITDEITISAWVYPHSYVYHGTVATKNGAYYFQVHSDGTVAAYTYYNNSGSLGSSHYTYSNSTVPLDAWTHIVFVENPDGTRHIYINGTEDTTDSAEPSIWSSNDDLGIGGETSGRRFEGIIDEVRIYDQALSATEAEKLYENQPLSNDHQNLGLTFYNSVNQSISQSITDSNSYGPCTTMETINAKTSIEWEETPPIGE